VALARALAVEPAALLLDEPFSALDTHLRGALERQLRDTLASYHGSTVFVSHNLEEAYRVCENLVVLAGGHVAARGPKEKVFRHPPTLEVARLTGCKNFSRARHGGDGLVEAIDWGCSVRVTQPFSKRIEHVAIRAHHIRIRPPGTPALGHENIFPCSLVSKTETPFRVTLDLRIGGPSAAAGLDEPPNATDFHVQAEVFKQEWEAFCDLAQPWQLELPADRLFLLPD
jgi:molybdate transport system permease protein